jgi:hypothetical protein
MVSSQIDGNGQSAWPARFRLVEPQGHWSRCRLRRTSHFPSTFLRSLRSRPVTALPRYYGRSDSCPLRRGSARVSSRRPPVRLLRGQVSLIHALGLLIIPSPTTCAGFALPGHVAHRQVEPRRHPLTGFPNGNSGLGHYTAGSPPTPAESSSVSSLTGKASYGLVVHLLLLPTPSCDDAVAVGYRFTLNLERTSTSPAKCALRRTVRRLDAAFLAEHAWPCRYGTVGQG